MTFMPVVLYFEQCGITLDMHTTECSRDQETLTTWSIRPIQWIRNRLEHTSVLRYCGCLREGIVIFLQPTPLRAFCALYALWETY